MDTTVFAELRFWLLVFFSLVLPFGIYGALLVRKAISRKSVMFFGFALVAIAGVDFYLLQYLATAARLSPSLADDAVFASEVSVALYLLPIMFGGIGVNLVSHALVRHLVEAERRFEEQHQDAPTVRSKVSEAETGVRIDDGECGTTGIRAVKDGPSRSERE